MDNNIQSQVTKAKFIIFGMIFIIVSLSLPQHCSIGSWEFSLNIWINIFNAIGSILIVGGIFEVVFKDQFIKQVSKDFIKALFLDKSSLHHFNHDDLTQMKKNIQEELLGEHNKHFKNKLLRMLNESFFRIAQGKHINDDFNMYYDYYNVVIYVKKSTSNYVCIEYDLKYKLKNTILCSKRTKLISQFWLKFSLNNTIFRESYHGRDACYFSACIKEK